MRILDENNNILESYDSTKGYLKEDINIIHHDTVEKVEEEGHYEVVKEYENGGQDVQWIVDVEGVEARDAYDEYENILRYVLYTEKELAAIEIENLKNELSNGDYKIIKCIEAQLVNEELPYDITLLHENREILRARINELESKIETLD